MYDGTHAALWLVTGFPATQVKACYATFVAALIAAHYPLESAILK